MRLVWAAAVLALGLVVAAFLIGGRYEFLPTDNNAVTRVDRLTGAVSMCVPGTAGTGCGFVVQNSN